jgi:predicted ATPase
MSGKSNFIDVFKFIRDLIVPGAGIQGLGNAIAKRNGFQEVAWKGEESNLISFTLDGTVPKEDGQLLKWSYHLEILGERRYGYTSVQREELTLFKPDGPIPLITSEQGHRILNDSNHASISQIHDTSRLALEYEFPDWEGNTIRASIASWRFYRLIPPLMRQANPSAAAQVLSESGDNLASWLLLLQTRHGEQFRRIVSVCREVFPDLQEVLSWPTQQSTVYLASREKYLKSPMTVWQMSDGELSFIALLSLVFAPVELGSALYCVEEPENFLHPRLLTVLAELLKQVQIELGSEKSAQLVISTHSPQLIDRVSIDNLVLFRREQGATASMRLRNNEHFRKLIESGEIGLGELYYSGALARA